MLQKSILFCLIISEIAIKLTAQESKNIQPAALGIHVSFDDFEHIENNHTYQGFSNLKPFIAISYLNGLSGRIDFAMMIAGSMIDFTNRQGVNYGVRNKKLLLEANSGIRAKLLAYPVLFNPFIDVGLGGSIYGSHYGAFAPLGIGLQVKINSRAFVLLNAQYRLPLTQTQDNHFFYSFGIAGNIGKGERMKQKAAPVERIVVMSAPTVIIPKDTDGDGIIDSLDHCPIIPGFEKYKGCPIPDTDGDGINDENDSCVTIPGVQRYHGCPIPDKDQDGVNDEEDQCPDVKGIIANKGCPLKIDSIREQINIAAKNIFFITGSYILSPKSFIALDEVVKILQDHPLFELAIEGHTDNVGSTAANQSLSEKRAKAVLEYLVQRGVIGQRLHAVGYGPSRPIADNSSVEGRTQNRRVEMRVVNE